MARRRGGAPLRASARALAIALVASTLVLAPVQRTEADEVEPFTVEFQTNDNGAIGLFGNNVLTCPVVPANPSRCLNARAGTGPNNTLNDNNHVMVNVDADTDPTTRNSASADVTVPDGSTILFAGLYWGARLNAGSGGSAAPAGATRTQMKLKVPGDSTYRVMEAQRTFGPTGSDAAYQRYRDVTAEVRAAGPGTYWGADVAAGTGEDRYGGWVLTVVYRNPALPLRNLTVFDGFADVGQGEPVTVGISGFLAPQSGAVETQLGMIAYDGDKGTTGDRALVLGSAPAPDTLLGTTLSPGTNFFNSSNDLAGASMSTRTPNDLNMLGYDIKNISASGAVPNGAQSASIQFSSTGDKFYPGVLTTAINLFSPDLSTSTKSVQNLAGRETAVPGDTLEYTLRYANTGQDGADDVVATDPIPAGTTYVPGSLEVLTGAGAGATTDAADGDRAEVVGDEVVFRLGEGATGSAGGDLPPGASSSYRFRVTADEEAAGTTVVNQAELAYVAATIGDPFTYSPNQTRTPVAAIADLSLTKSTSPDPGVAGGTVTSTLTVQNAGPSTARDVVVTDQLPAGVTLADAPGCTAAASTVTCPIGTVAPGSSATRTVTVTIPPGSDALSLVNVASVTSSTADPDPDDNSAGSTVAVTRQADLEVTKSASPTTVAPGQTTTFTVTTRNAGPSNAVDILVTDRLPDQNLALTSATAPGATCTVTADVAQCAAPLLAPGATLTMTVVGRVSPDAPGALAIVNTASATSSTADPDATDNSASSTVTTTAPAADLATTKTSSAAVAGGQVTYTVTTTNNGPSSADAVTLADALPAGLVPVSAVPSRGTCTVGATVTCDVGTLSGPDPVGQRTSVTVTITADVPADFPVGPVSNTVTTTTPTADPVPDNDDATVVTDVTAVADVAVTKTAAPLQPAAGDDVTFTVTVSNTGPSTARDVVLADALPDGLTLVAVDPATCSGAPALSCPIGDLDPGGTATVTVVMSVPSDFDLDAGAVNTATVSSATPDPAPANDTATATATTRAISDLIALKWDTTDFPSPPGTPPTRFVAGETVTYYLAAGNLGPSDATTARVTDTLPPGVTFVSSVPECAFTPPDQVVCDLPTVPDQFAAIFPVTVRLDADLPAGTLLTNSASIELTDPDRVDPVSSNNVAAVTNPVGTATDLSVVKSTYSLDLPSFGFTIPSAAPAGTPTGYLIEVRNDGPSVARDVVLVDTSTMTDFFLNEVRLIRPGLDPVQLTCSFSGGDLECPLGDLPVFAPGDPAWGIQVDGVTLSNASAGSYENTAVVTSATPETDPGDNTSTAPITVTDPVATLTIEKTSVGSTDVDGDSDLDWVPGASFSYQLTVANVVDLTREGAADADDVVVTDTLPPGFTASDATSSQGVCTVTPPSTVECELGTVLGPGRVPEPPPVVITVSGTIGADFRGTATNTATVTSPISVPASAEHTQDLVPVGDLAVTKIPDAPQVAAGATAGFSIVVTNAGPSDALETEVGDLLPAGLTFVPELSDPSCAVVDSPAGPFVSCAAGTLTVGETRVVRVAGLVDPGLAPGELVNTAAASSAITGEYDFGNNLSEVPFTVVQAADLVTSKVADATTVTVGSEVTYTVSITNAGPSNATDVVVTDQVPDGMTVVSVPPGCAVDGSTVTCTDPALVAGASLDYAIVLAVPVDITPGTLTNTASATSATPDPDATNSSATATVEAIILSDVAITKTLLTDPVVAGQPLTYQIAITNSGPNDAPDVVYSDTLPPGTSLISTDPAPGTVCTALPEDDLVIVGCEVDVLPVGQTLTGTLTISTPPDLTGSISNTAFVGSGANDSDLFSAGSQNESTALGTVVAQVDAGVSVVADSPTVAPGGVATFTVTVTNDGPSVARAVQLVNTLPAGLTDPTAPAVDPFAPAEPFAPTDPFAVVQPFAVVEPQSCTLDALVATCELGDLAPGDVATLTFGGRVPAAAADGTVLTDTAAVLAEGDTVSGNDVASTQVVVEAPAPPTAPTAPPEDAVGGAPGALAVTGDPVAALALLGLLLVGAGSAARLVPRQRRRS